MKTFNVYFTDGSRMRIDAFTYVQARAIAEVMVVDERVVDMVEGLDVYA